MKKVYFLRNNAYSQLVSVDEEKNCRYLNETTEFPYIVGTEEKEAEKAAIKFMETIEDDSDWNDDCTYEQLFEEFPVEIIAEIEKDL